MGRIPRYFFRNVPRRPAGSRPATGERSGISGECRFLDGHSRRFFKVANYSAGGLSHLPRHGVEGRRNGMPGMRWHRTGDADGRADEIQYPVPALRRHRTGTANMRDLPWTRNGGTDGDGGISHQTRNPRWAAHSSGRERKCWYARRGGRGLVPDCSRRQPSSLYAERR